MPINKAAYLRYKFIDEMLQSRKRRWSRKEILFRLNTKLQLHMMDPNVQVSVSQLRYDMQNMQEVFGAPIDLIREGHSVYYRYEYDFTIATNNELLNEVKRLQELLDNHSIKHQVSEIFSNGLDVMLKNESARRAEEAAAQSKTVAHGIGTIQATTQYHLFKSIDCNRTVDRSHVARILKAIRKKNLLHLNPITVDKDMNVIDGQHRLQAAKIAKVPIYYQRDEKVTEEDMSDMNSVKKNWALADYLNFYIKRGLPAFLKFAEVMERYPEVPTSTLLKIVSGNLNTRSNDVRNGAINIENIDKADVFISNINEVAAACPAIAGSRMAEAMIFFCNHPEYDHKRMMHRLTTNPGEVYPCNNKKQCIQMLQSVYNYKAREENVVIFLRR